MGSCTGLGRKRGRRAGAEPCGCAQGWGQAGGAGVPLGARPRPEPSAQPCGSRTVTHLQGHLPGPGARHRILPVDDPLAVLQRGADRGHPAACGRCSGARGWPGTAPRSGLVPRGCTPALRCHPRCPGPPAPQRPAGTLGAVPGGAEGRRPLHLPGTVPPLWMRGSAYLRRRWRGPGRQLPTEMPSWEDVAASQGYGLYSSWEPRGSWPGRARSP